PMPQQRSARRAILVLHAVCRAVSPQTERDSFDCLPKTFTLTRSVVTRPPAPGHLRYSRSLATWEVEGWRVPTDPHNIPSSQRSRSSLSVRERRYMGAANAVAQQSPTILDNGRGTCITLASRDPARRSAAESAFQN